MKNNGHEDDVDAMIYILTNRHVSTAWLPPFLLLALFEK